MTRKYVAIAIGLLAAVALTPAGATPLPPPPNGVWWPVPGTSTPGSPQTRRVAVRPVIPSPLGYSELMITITYDCGAPAPCTTPEIPAFALTFPSSLPNQYVTVTPLPSSAPRTRFVFMWAPGRPCVDSARFAADSYVGVWTGGGGPDFGECMGKLPPPPPGSKPDTQRLHNPIPPIQLRTLPPMGLPPPPAIPRGRKPS
jgi:hypothetical protein